MTKKARASTAGKTTSTGGANAPVELDSTETEFRALKSKPKWTWEPSTVLKDQWTTASIPEGEACTPRIRRLDAKTYACYRDAAYLGTEPTLELAQMRCAVNQRSQRNRFIGAWEREHPDEIPPFMLLTEQERAAYRQRNPIAPALRSQPGGLPKAVGGGGVPATPGQRARAELVADSGKAPGAKPPRAVPAIGRGLAGVVRAVAGAKPLGKAGTKWWTRQEAVLKGSGRTVAELNDKDAIKHMLAKGQITVEEK